MAAYSPSDSSSPRRCKITLSCATSFTRLRFLMSSPFLTSISPGLLPPLALRNKP